MFAQNPKTGKPIRIMRSEASLWRSQKTFVWLRDLDPSIPWNRWETCAVGVAEIHTWEARFKPDNVLLTTTTDEDTEWFLSTDLSQYKMVFISRDMVYKVGEAKFRSMRLTNVICLEEATKMYPYLGDSWTGTAEDAVLLAGILLRNRKIIGLSEQSVQERVKLLRDQGFEFQLVESGQPKQLWYLTQYYKPEKGRREREIRECLEKNLACRCIDKVVLLNEKDLSKEWASMKAREKIHQEILGTRLTYKAVLQWIQTNAPPNVLCVFANADIYLDDETWKDVWSVRTENVFFALLRWDVQEGDEPAKLFGPRNDSQDTWMVDSDSVQKTTWDWASLDFPFGKAGCDNAITVEMLKKKFLVVNPALSLKTHHNHKTNIRSYDVADVVDKPIYLYVDPTGFHDMEPIFDVSKFQDQKMEYSSFDRKLSSSQAKVLDVYCKMLERGERYVWKSQSPNSFSVESVPIHRYTHVFQTPQGLVYGLNKLFIGKEESSKEAWSRSQLSPVSPTFRVDRAFAVPWREDEVRTAEGYLLYYVSKIHLLRKRYGNGEFWAPSKGIVPVLEMFEWGTRELPVLPHSANVQIWCKEAIQYPWLNKQEIHKEEIDALRSSLRKEWVAEKDSSRKWIVMIDGDLITLDMVRRWEEVAPELDWGVIFQGSTSTERIIEKLSGAEGFICAGGPNSVSRWGLSWALPKGAKIIEIQNEMEPNGEAAHVSGAAGLDHSLVIIPRASKEATKEAIVKHVMKTLETVSTSKKDSSNLPIIRMPSVKQGFFSHAGDSFREMVRLWEEKGYVKVIEDSTVNIWLGSIGDVLLYDRPTMDWLFASPQAEQLWKNALFGNPKPTESGGESSSWFFWPRKPRLVEEIVNAGDVKKSFAERKYRLVFYGKIENKVQEKRRLKENWESAFLDSNDEYKMVKGDEKYSLSQKEYLLRLADAKYGLCLAGFGKKCHREVECMAMGCVPLCASDVDMENYANPPVEGTHYLRVGKPEHIGKLLESVSEEKWMEMSAACRNWWTQNASAEGSWVLTQKLTQRI